MIFTRLRTFFSSFYNWYLTLLGALVSLAFLAPLTLALGLTPLAKIIYFIYSFFCHQFATRSFYLFDYQFAWCARDTGIWVGMFLAALLLKLNKIKGIKWYWVIPFIIPMILDGSIQTIFTFLNLNPDGTIMSSVPYLSNNLTRFMTGSVFGIGLSLWLSNLMFVESSPKKEMEEKKDSKKGLKNIYKIIILILAMFPLYLGLIGVWELTSSRVTPQVPIDAVPKSDPDGFFIRRADGACPVNAIEDFVAIECFFKN